MYQGKLWLDYSTGNNAIQFQASITRCIRRDTEISFEFNGNDRDEGPFSGHCKAVLRDTNYKGEGEFTYPDGTIVKANVTFTANEEDTKLYLSGEWKDEGEVEPYELDAELVKQ